VTIVNYLPPCYGIEYQCDQATDRIFPLVSLAANTCPADVNSLTSLLIRDLPSYANRLIQRRRKRTDELYSSLVTVGKPDFRSIEITSREYPARFPQSAPTQVFITTLERQYTGIKSAEIQQFHWLFMAKTRFGWRLSNIYSRTSIGKLTADAPIAPPTESSRTIVGEAISIWLNDCYLGKVKS
jgi:hypothetical protein